MKTGTTRTPAFWDIPAAPWLPIVVIHIRSQAKTRQSQSYKWLNLLNTFIATFWSCLIRYIIWNGSNQSFRCYRAYTECVRSETNIPPTTSLCEGYNNEIIQTQESWNPIWILMKFDLKVIVNPSTVWKPFWIYWICVSEIKSNHGWPQVVRTEKGYFGGRWNFESVIMLWLPWLWL